MQRSALIASLALASIAGGSIPDGLRAQTPMTSPAAHLVWTQDRNSEFFEGDFRAGRDFGGLFDDEADNIFLVKLTYWLGL